MHSEFLNLDKILNLVRWQKFQDSIALVTKMAVLTVDFRGKPVTNHSRPQIFCSEIRKDPHLFVSCQKCDSRGGLEAVRQNAPYIYYCHYNIVDMAIPITVDNKYLGAIMIGQTKLAAQDNAILEKILTVSDELYVRKLDLLKREYETLPVLTYDEIKNIADMVFQLSNYIVEEALNKNLAFELYQQASNDKSLSVPSGYTAQNIENTKNAITNTLLDKRLISLSEDTLNCSNAVLKPIFVYIADHKSEHVLLKKAAALCHISTSHFSRIFTKETGENYSYFIPHLKITWSKRLLTDTDLSISQICEELGFSETGYFIKTFKKYENTTPAVYRKYNKNTDTG